MNADVAGPLRVKGRDPESCNHRTATFMYFVAVSYRFPRLTGVKEESDPAAEEGFDDPALLPTGTDDLADHAPVVVEGADAEVPHPEGPGEGEDYEESVREPSSGEEEEEEEEEQERPREFAAKVQEHP